jgi:hypothetical protein
MDNITVSIARNRSSYSPGDRLAPSACARIAQPVPQALVMLVRSHRLFQKSPRSPAHPICEGGRRLEFAPLLSPLPRAEGENKGENMC